MPNDLKPFKCKSTGLLPILHPPGIDILHLPNLANIGPITKKDALIFLLGSTSFKFKVFIFKSPVIDENCTSQFNSRNKLIKTVTSSNIGTFFKIISVGFKIVATIMGNTEFFAILISTSP